MEHPLQHLISEATYNDLFPHRNIVYTYDALLDATNKYPDFVNNGDDVTNLNELVAFLANVAHETTGGWPDAPGGTYAWGLHFAEEVGCEDGKCTQYSADNPTYPSVPGQTYQGRGAIQLSWNYNYGQASEAIFNDKEVLLKNPSQVASTPQLAWQTALWFWMTPQPPKPSCHNVMASLAGDFDNDLFGETVNIINGGIECGNGMNDSLANRIGFYHYFAQKLGAPEPQNLGLYCANLQR